MSWLSRALSWAAAAVVGGLFGVSGTIGHSLWWGVVPIGMVVGAVACGGILIAIRALTRDRGATLFAGLGMVGMLLLISGVGPGGSVIVPDTPAGRVWTYLVAGLVLLTVAWPSLSRLPVRTEAPRPTPSVPVTVIPEVSGRPGIAENRGARET